MLQSEQINELAGALAKAQAQVKHASKEKTNPHFKSRYADLAAVWDACRDGLSSNGLAIAQSAGVSADGKAVLHTILMHASGQWLRGTLELPVSQNTAQAMGSALTYARRYSLAAMVGVAPDDDDGNAASTGHSNSALYDHSSEADRTWLKEKLTGYNVPIDLQRPIAVAFNGKPKTDLSFHLQSYKDHQI